MSQKKVFVYLSHHGCESLMGILSIAVSRGEEIFSFSYASDWLKKNHYQYIDPDLNLFAGAQYPDREKKTFGLFLDSSPDRWGRIIMKRREALFARREERKERTLYDSDFLLGVYDENRMGGLRFKLNENEDYLSSDTELAAPPWTSISELANFSLQFEQKDAELNPDYYKWLSALVAPGSSLGGARPKASVTDSDGNLWIAKFPSRSDEFNIGCWEEVANELATMVGITTPFTRIEKYNNDNHTFMTKRFDRDGANRIHFASAMTMLGYTDGAGANDGVSYLEIVDFISKYGARTEEDLRELFKRIVFNILISNTDDHLRNHGFLLTDNGWILSPAYDINPSIDRDYLSLNISESDSALDLDLPLENSEYFRIKENEASKLIQSMKQVVSSNWKHIARKKGVSVSEIDRMKKAFSNYGGRHFC